MARGGNAGAAAREAKVQAAERLSAKAKASLAKGKAAVAKRQERKLNAQRMASPGKLREKWDKRKRGGRQGQSALASVSGGGGNSTRAIGKPGMAMYQDRKETLEDNAFKAEQLRDAKTRFLAR